MKGTFFQKPLEYKVEISGESWSQGSPLKGSLVVINHSRDEIDLSKIGCHLCFCNTKKLKAKDIKAIVLQESVLFSETILKAKSESLMEFEFNLKSDCPITENTASLYLICADIEKPFEGGQLELKVTPIKIINDFIEIFEQFFRFKFKALRNKKQYIDAKIAAPDSKDWTSIQAFNILMKLSDESLELNFVFKLKKMSYTDDINKTKDTILEIKKIMTKREYSGFRDSPNQDNIMKVIAEVLEQVKLKPVI
jgi:hypothetical protein